jgi:hypothetical protein
MKTQKIKFPILSIVISCYFFFFSVLGASEFDRLMEKKSVAWTQEDQKRFDFFKQFYDQKIVTQGQIPKTLHFIWLGPKPYPTESLTYLQKWIQLHPCWAVKLWTDQERSLSIPGLQIVPFKEFPLGLLTECYFQSDSFGERSEVLRYAILFNEGGFYIDHDLIPLKSLHEWDVDFLCGLEPIQPSIMSSCVMIGTCILGSIPHHPFLSQAIDWLHQEWSRLETRYPGNTSEAIYNRVMHRSARALDQGIHKVGLDSSLRNLILPSNYFNSSDSKSAISAIHLKEQTWLKKNPAEEKQVQTLLQKISSRVDLLSLLLYTLGALNLIAGGYLFFTLSKRLKTV